MAAPPCTKEQAAKITQAAIKAAYGKKAVNRENPEVEKKAA